MDTSGTVTVPNAATYNDVLANTEVVGKVGDILEMTVKNLMPEAENQEALDTGFFAPANNLQMVHWHGMELDNESDGQPISEIGMQPGQSRLYRYRLYRPGLFWFHPHILPLLTESRGQAGRLIIRSEAEEKLEDIGVLPEVYKAFTLLDTTVANEFNRTQLGPGGEVFDNFTDEEVDNNLMPDKSPDLNNDGMCDRGAQGRDCIVEEGELVLVNGVVPTSDANIPVFPNYHFSHHR
jgi:FtsP/CotA-like multicopper oxidase with cupredoxin domain